MCGLYGIFDKSQGGLIEGDLNLFSQMGTLTELRGRHSSGCFSVNGELNPSPLVKVVGPSVNMLFDKQWERFKVFAKGGRAMVGHGRMATIGKVNKTNAHPFREGRYTLVHNGTIREGLDVKEHKVEVDSHALVKSIAEKGLKAAIEELRGAWAIILYDHEKKVVQFLRNFERELFYVDNHLAMYVMSEEGALDYLMKRNKLHGKIEAFKANTLYTFDCEQLRLVEGEKIEGNIYPKYTAHQQYRGYQEHWTGGTNSASRTNGSLEELKKDYRPGDNVEFEVTAIYQAGGQIHFLGYDEKDNEVRFTTGNTKAANLIAKGDKGVGAVSSLTLDYQRKKVTYTLRFREIIWDRVLDGDAPKPETVETYGGFRIAKTEWEIMCATQQCWSCQGNLDANEPEGCVVVKHGSVLRPYCSDCVSDYRSLYGSTPLNSADKQYIANALARIQ